MNHIFGAGRARLGFEALETRELMAASLTASLSNGVLRVEGTPNADHIRIEQTPTKISVVNIQTGGTVASASTAAVQHVVVDGLAGDDQVWVNYGSGALTPLLEVSGSEGRDVLHSRGTTQVAGLGDGVRKSFQVGNTVYTLHSDGWVRINGAQSIANVRSLETAQDGTVVALNDARQLLRMRPGAGWEQIDAGVKQWSMSPDGTLFVSNDARQLLRLRPGAGWEQIDAGVKQWAMAPDGTLLVSNDARQLLRMQPGASWEQIGAGVQQFALSHDGVLFTLGTNGLLEKRDLSSNWHTLETWGIASIAINPLGEFVPTYTPVKVKWQELTAQGVALGQPVGGTVQHGAGVAYQEFTGGVILAGPGGCFAMKNAAWNLAKASGLGLPIEKEVDLGGGWRGQLFQNGAVAVLGSEAVVLQGTRACAVVGQVGLVTSGDDLAYLSAVTVASITAEVMIIDPIESPAMAGVVALQIPNCSESLGLRTGTTRVYVNGQPMNSQADRDRNTAIGVLTVLVKSSGAIKDAFFA
jgi:hypothetical protein